MNPVYKFKLRPRTKKLTQGLTKRTHTIITMCCGDCHRFAVVASTFLVCYLTVGTAYGNAPVYYIHFLDYFHDLRSVTSLIGAVNIGVILTLGPVSAMLANRFGHRLIVCCGAVLSSAGMVAASFATSVPWLLATHIVCGLGWCLSFTPASMGVSYYWNEKYLGIIFGITISGVGVGQFVSPLLVEALIERYTWRGALLIQGGINLNLLLTGALLFPVPGMKKRSNFMELQLLKDKYFVNTLIYWIFMHMGVSVASVHIAYVVRKALNSSYQQSALMTAILGIANACARLGHGCISKLPKVNVLLQQLVSVCMMAVCLICMPWITSLPVMVTVIVIAGIGMGSMSLNSILTLDIVGMKSRTAGYGFFAMSAGIGLACGAPIAGLLSDLTNGEYASSLYFGGGIQLLSVLMELGTLIKWRRVKSRHTEELDIKPPPDEIEDEDCDEEMVMRVTTA